MEEEELRKKERKNRGHFHFIIMLWVVLQSTHPELVSLLNNFIKLDISLPNHVLSILFVDTWHDKKIEVYELALNAFGTVAIDCRKWKYQNNMKCSKKQTWLDVQNKSCDQST